MMKNKNLLIGLFYLFVPIIVNFVVLIVTLLIDFPLPDSNEYKIWLDFLSNHFVLSNVPTFFSFLIPIILCIIYVLPIFKKTELAKNRSANIPIVFSALGVLGWILMFLIQTAITLYIDFVMKQKIYSCLRVSAMFSLLAAILAFVVTFLILETANHTWILKNFFPNGKISIVKNFIKPSIRFTFLMCYIGTGIFPVIVLLFALITKEKNLGIKISYNLILIIIIFLVIGIFVTLLLSNLFRKPLKELTSVAQKIEKGDLKNRVKVTSGDEIGILGDTFNDMASSLEEKEFMKDVFGKIVTPNVRDYLLTGGSSRISLGGENTNVTILFCDIRGFTTLSEKMECEKIVQMLNYYFSAMSECITQNNGIINKFIGDAIMAIFGAPIKNQTHAKDAYKAALDMKKALEKVNKEFSEQGIPAIRFGIGIHTGTVLAGNIGSSSRMEYTVIGDTVNVASRIEGLCKEYKKDLLISEATVKELDIDNVNFPKPEFLCESQIRGKQEKVGIYSV